MEILVWGVCVCVVENVWPLLNQTLCAYLLKYFLGIFALTRWLGSIEEREEDDMQQRSLARLELGLLASLKGHSTNFTHEGQFARNTEN